MAVINAQLVKQLREMTGAGMMDCKKALTETDGNIDKAVDVLREKGLGKAAKKADRLASEGLISVEVNSNHKIATMSEINSETDFVAKNENFINLTSKTTSHILANDISNVEDLMSSQINGTSFEEDFNTQVSKIGEHIVVRRFATLKAGENGVVNGYCHSNGRVGVLLSAKCENEEVAAKSAEFIKQLCMHAAAMKPSFLSYTELDPGFIEKETVAFRADIEKRNEELARMKKPLKKVPMYGSQLQLSDEVMEQAKKDIEAELKAQNKPEKIWNRIIPGLISRFVADNTQLDQQFTLLSQFYVIDDKKTIEQVIEEKSKEFGGKIELVDYVRFELGEGLEKKGCDFASEVADQLK